MLARALAAGYGSRLLLKTLLAAVSRLLPRNRFLAMLAILWSPITINLDLNNFNNVEMRIRHCIIDVNHKMMYNVIVM